MSDARGSAEAAGVSDDEEVGRVEGGSVAAGIGADAADEPVYNEGTVITKGGAGLVTAKGGITDTMV